MAPPAPIQPSTPPRHALGRLVDRLGHDRHRLSEAERRRITVDLFPEGLARRQFVGRFASLMTLSVLIAVLGLMADSTAVVIGAMLVAPLMLPVLGMAAAVVRGWPRRLAVMALITLAGTAGAVVLAALTSWLIPGRPDPLPGEIVARTAPNLLDLGIALVAGAAAAYARARRQAADAITGVAVAVALVPPLATGGVLLELGHYHMATGAMLLFTANVVGIVSSAAVIFIATGYVPTRQLRYGDRRIGNGLRLTAAAVVVVTLPLAFGYRAEPAPTTTNARVAIDRAVSQIAPSLTVVETDVSVRADETVIDLVVTEPEAAVEPIDTDQVAELVADELEQPVVLRMQAVATDRSGARADG
ncbi:MAG: DUF389 domain-containing protein [Acidimicrobiia bacterium]|nr:DUF389 domain-containing protein [Acidimicrobiia bacterium]